MRGVDDHLAEGGQRGPGVLAALALVGGEGVEEDDPHGAQEGIARRRAVARVGRRPPKAPAISPAAAAPASVPGRDRRWRRARPRGVRNTRTATPRGRSKQGTIARMLRRVALGLALFAGCAASPPSPDPGPAPMAPPASARAPVIADAGAPAAPVVVAPAPPAPPVAPAMEMKQLSEKDWLAAVRQKVGERQKVEAAALRFSASKQLITFVREVPAPPPRKKPRRPPPRRYGIGGAVDTEGSRRAVFVPGESRGAARSRRRICTSWPRIASCTRWRRRLSSGAAAAAEAWVSALT